MIDQTVKIHDQYTFEIKLGFHADNENDKDDYNMNIWMFIPDSLDINRSTYKKSDFYRDIRTYTRLITPTYHLDDLAKEDNLPFCFLKKSIEELITTPERKTQSDFEYHAKMYISIVKSSLRDEINKISAESQTETMDKMIFSYLHDCNMIRKMYRNLWQEKIEYNVNTEAQNTFRFCDEFLSNLMEYHTFRLLSKLDKCFLDKCNEFRQELLDLIKQETTYREKCHYLNIENDNKRKNRDFVFRMGLLKKYVECVLFLDTKKKKDGIVAEQLFLSLAAGIAMIFATVISFTFKQRLGAYTLSLFFVMVISYMLKDRIKDLCRFYFSKKMNKHYFDHKIDMHIHRSKIGTIKEAMDFIREKQIPNQIQNKLHRSALLEADNEIYTEQTILYRTRLSIDTEKLCSASQYPLSGIAAIIRMNLSHMILKMDNSEFPLFCPAPQIGYKKIKGERIYYLYFVIQIQHNSQDNLKGYRIAFNRNGIKSIVSEQKQR